MARHSLSDGAPARLVTVLGTLSALWLLLSQVQIADGGCVITDEIIPPSTTTRCPCFPENMDITDKCTLVEHKPSSGSGTVRCRVEPTCFEDCPGVQCRLYWTVNRTADGRFHVLMVSNTRPGIHCSVWPHDSVQASLRDCSEVYIPTPCDDVQQHHDGRMLFGTPVVHSCTCTGANCTRNFMATISVDVKESEFPVAIPAVAGTGAVLGIFCGCLVAIMVYRRHQRSRISALKAQKNLEKSSLLAFGTPVPVEKGRTIARGRFGVVWHGVGSNGEELAVKVTSEKNKESWLNECELFSNGFMGHSSIVRFHFGEEKVCSHCKELWLVMEFCSQGSLCSYLKSTPVSWNECVDFMSSLAVGVDYLHSDNVYKPQIAHRDLKSTNVLVKLTPQPHCVIADFGLATALLPGMDIGVLQRQAGTPRYMAPECLLSSVNFHDHKSFLNMDIYALALLLWEIGACCQDFYNKCDCAGTHHELPYWIHVGDQPNLRLMLEVVVNQQMRPVVPPGWKTAMSTVKDLRTLSSVLSDSWEKNPDARLTAAAIKNRLCNLRETKVTTEAAIKAAIVLAAETAAPVGALRAKGSSLPAPAPVNVLASGVLLVDQPPKYEANEGMAMTEPPKSTPASVAPVPAMPRDMERSQSSEDDPAAYIGPRANHGTGSTAADSCFSQTADYIQQPAGGGIAKLNARNNAAYTAESESCSWQ